VRHGIKHRWSGVHTHRAILGLVDDRPVGMFDSGVGGLSVLRHFRRLAPHEDIIYFADTAMFPYGPRPTAEVRKRSFAIANRLLASDVKMVVVACNTASAAAVDDLRQAFPVRFVGMVPGLKPAAQKSKSGRVAILATEGTLDGELLARVVDEFGKGTRIATIPGAGLAELVEAGGAGSQEARDAVRSALADEVERGTDTVVLGCTHYNFLAGAISAEFPALDLVDTSEPVARRAAQVLRDEGLETSQRTAGALSFIVSGDRDRFREVVDTLELNLGTEAMRS
jgi:glutamate racemase